MLSVGFGLKILNSMKYNVSFIQGENKVLLVDNLTDVQACQYAINLHQSSNLPHKIVVRSSADDAKDIVVLLTLCK